VDLTLLAGLGLLKGKFTQKLKLAHDLLTLKPSWVYMTCFFLFFILKNILMACSFSITIYVKLVFYFIDKNNLCTQSTLQPVCYRYRAILHGHELDIAHAL